MGKFFANCRNRLITAVNTLVRFDMPDENGEKRRDKYERLAADGVLNKDTGLPLEAPELDIPEEYADIWSMFFNISDQVSRIRDGVCGRIPPTEYKAWFELNGITVEPYQYSLLVDMDERYCVAMNVELAEYRKRQENVRKK